ncbi:uncharacterized protein LOC119980466 [Tripterygium wilfordii]|uniref:uncharacterized protein LOC119980466 n=1 Tax=Tripterygium wilfordii TaxID=458696 RepID=UPI0018F83D1E|nr:uncharacterized protein LOC119980466 [Tripterygium wilfordii]
MHTQQDCPRGVINTRDRRRWIIDAEIPISERVSLGEEDQTKLCNCEAKTSTEMAVTVTMLGALWGLSVQLHSNALRRVPYMRHPWEHLIAMGCGSIFLNELTKFDKQIVEDTEKLVQKSRAANERRYFDEDE